MAATREPNSAAEAELVELYHAHSTGLLRYASGLAGTPEECRDAVQETFLRYFTERREGRAIEHPRAWLFQVLRNYLLSSLTAGYRRETAAGGIDSLPGAGIDPETLAARRQRARTVLASLTPREFDCLRLRAAGCSYSEIAGLLHIRSGTVGAILTKTQRKLRGPGENGKVGLGTASAIHELFLEAPAAR
jgi:RNA polymerase sigma-70 factor (ECF subfamily)